MTIQELKIQKNKMTRCFFAVWASLSRQTSKIVHGAIVTVVLVDHVRGHATRRQ